MNRTTRITKALNEVTFGTLPLLAMMNLDLRVSILFPNSSTDQVHK
jgi:hypothetical protein